MVARVALVKVWMSCEAGGYTTALVVGFTVTVLAAGVTSGGAAMSAPDKSQQARAEMNFGVFMMDGDSCRSVLLAGCCRALGKHDRAQGRDLLRVATAALNDRLHFLARRMF